MEIKEECREAVKEAMRYLTDTCKHCKENGKDVRLKLLSFVSWVLFFMVTTDMDMTEEKNFEKSKDDLFKEVGKLVKIFYTSEKEYQKNE